MHEIPSFWYNRNVAQYIFCDIYQGSSMSHIVQPSFSRLFPLNSFFRLFLLFYQFPRPPPSFLAFSQHPSLFVIHPRQTYFSTRFFYRTKPELKVENWNARIAPKTILSHRTSISTLIDNTPSPQLADQHMPDVRHGLPSISKPA